MTGKNKGDILKFTGKVYPRSTNKTNGPPGEAAILKLNPDRKARILKETGWKDLFPGSLNLKDVEERIVHILLLHDPLIKECANSITYPKGWENISKRRVGYLYYRAVLTHQKKWENILIRRACNPLRNRLEAFAQDKLRDKLGLEDDDEVTCKVDIWA